MSDKLDFSGFEAPVEMPTAPTPPKQRRTPSAPKAPRAKQSGSAPSRRKRRVNVSIEPALSSKAVSEAGKLGVTLSDLLRSAYRESGDRRDSSWVEPEPAPFESRSAAVTGRIVHMLYLTDEEVGILDLLAREYRSSRSGVVAALLRFLIDN